MSAFDYDRTALNAARIIGRYGRSWQIRSTVTANAVSTRDAIGVKIDEVRHVQDDSGIQIGDSRFLFRADAMPVVGERLRAGSDSIVIVHTEAIKPADVVLAWWVWARAG